MTPADRKELAAAVGFGISKPEHVADVWRYADAAVVGSAIVAEIEQAQSAAEALSRVGRFTRELIFLRRFSFDPRRPAP